MLSNRPTFSKIGRQPSQTDQQQIGQELLLSTAAADQSNSSSSQNQQQIILLDDESWVNERGSQIRQNKREGLVRECPETGAVNGNVADERVDGLKGVSCSQATCRSFKLNISNQNTNSTNHSHNSQNQLPQLTISQIKQINRGSLCTDFIFCQAIPSHIPCRSSSLLSAEQLDRIASNFDIVLFKNSSMISRVQRFITGSDYDHVAMVVELKGHRYLLEAAGNSGVSLSHFNKFVATLKRTQGTRTYEVGYRKFMWGDWENHKERGQAVELLQKFVENSVGTKYKFSPIYLLSKTHQKEQQSYFCSQLLAECLQFCKLVRLNQPAYKILPRDFAHPMSARNSQEIDSKDADIFGSRYEKLRKVQSSTHNKIR